MKLIKIVMEIYVLDLAFKLRIGNTKANLDAHLPEFIEAGRKKNTHGEFAGEKPEVVVKVPKSLAYKPMVDIVKNIGDTVEVIERIRPIYKAAE